MTDLLADILNLLDQLSIIWLTVAVFVFTALESSLLVGLFIPGELIIVTAGAATSNLQEVLLVATCATIGVAVGQSGGYLIGHTIGPSIRTRILRRWISNENWLQAEALLNRGVGPGVMMAQFIPVVHATLPIVAGITRVPYRRFASWAALASLMWALIYTTIGSIFGQFARENPHNLGWIAVGLVAAIALLWAIGYAINAIFRRNKKRIYPRRDLRWR